MRHNKPDNQNTTRAMKITKFLFAFIALLSSCSQTEIECYDNPQQNNTDRYSSIINMACESYNAINSSSRSAYSVASVYPWLKSDIYSENYSISRSSDDLPDTLLYIVNFSNENGSVIVSDNDKFKGVVAVIDEGNIDPKESIDVPGITFFMESFRESLKNNMINQTTDFADIAEYLPQNDIAAEADTSVWTTSQLISPLLITRWGQGNPYNKYCFTPNGSQAMAGCVPIAIAQLLTYYKHPKRILDYTVQWEHLGFSYPSSLNQAENVGKFVSAIGRYVHSDYGEESTGTNSDSIAIFLHDHGFEATASSGFSNEMAVHNLKEYGPFIAGGMNYMFSGHGWVIDGVHIQIKNHAVRFLFHCNWGWNGKYNGYFLSSAFDPYCDGINPDEYRKYQFGIRHIGFIKKP